MLLPLACNALAQSLHPRLKLLACQPPAGPLAVKALQETFPQIPADYFELVSQASELELVTDTGRDFRVYDPEGVSEMTGAYQIPSYIPGAVVVGDSYGQALIYANGAFGFGVYRVGWGDLDIQNACWIAPTLRAFLFEGVGLDR